MSCCCHAAGNGDGVDEACGIGNAFAGDVIGSAVVNRGPDDGQSQGYINPVFKVQELQRDKPLVVVHADHDVIAPLRGIVKERISGIRAARIDAPLLRLYDGRDYGFLFFAAEHAFLSGVGIEGGYGDAWGGQREAVLQRVIGNEKGVDDFVLA